MERKRIDKYLDVIPHPQVFLTYLVSVLISFVFTSIITLTHPLVYLLLPSSRIPISNSSAKMKTSFIAAIIGAAVMVAAQTPDLSQLPSCAVGLSIQPRRRSAINTKFDISCHARRVP